MALHGSQLRGLLLGHDDGLPMRGRHHQHASDQRDDRPHAQGAVREIGVTPVHPVPARDGHEGERAHNEKREQGVRVGGQGLGVECRGKEIRQLRGARLAVDRVAGRRLHPTVCDDDPQSRQRRARPHEPRTGHIELLAHTAAPEHEYAEEGGLEEKRQQSLGGQRRAEDVAHKARVVGPVRAEAELHGDARGHAAGKDQREELHEEGRLALVGGVARARGAGGEDGNSQPEAHRQRDEYKVHEHREGELRARQKHRIEKIHWRLLLNTARCLRRQDGRRPERKRV